MMGRLLTNWGEILEIQGAFIFSREPLKRSRRAMRAF